MDIIHWRVAAALIWYLGSVHAYNKAVLGLYVQRFRGEGTYVGRGQSGSCQMGPEFPPVATHPRIKSLVAINAEQYSGSLACGMCFRVLGTGVGTGSDPIKGDFYVFVNDICPECKEGDIDLAEEGDGSWEVEIQAVQCPVGNTKIEYKFQGSNPWYIKLQVRNARLPVNSILVDRDGQPEPMKHTSDGFWELSDGLIELPIKLEMTSINGESIRDIITRIENDVIIHGENGVQFNRDNRLPHA
ncbi:expansin-YoaJ-like [Haliotis asinina]|uniref:expansin-YoaJ-like n=1 Tax=Haliotis asinina TaxID=109174 RepID=UPI003531A736